MKNVKKIDKRLAKLYRWQKRLEKKRKKLNKLAAKGKKQAAWAKKQINLANLPVKNLGKRALPVEKKKGGFVKRFILSLAVSLVCTAVAYSAAKMWNARKGAEAKMPEGEALNLDLTNGASDYETASLEELEDALLRVENQLDEVSAAIEKSKK